MVNLRYTWWKKKRSFRWLVPRCEPWCWKIYLHLPKKSPSYVGKYTIHGASGVYHTYHIPIIYPNFDQLRGSVERTWLWFAPRHSGTHFAMPGDSVTVRFRRDLGSMWAPGRMRFFTGSAVSTGRKLQGMFWARMRHGKVLICFNKF